MEDYYAVLIGLRRISINSTERFYLKKYTENTGKSNNPVCNLTIS